MNIKRILAGAFSVLFLAGCSSTSIAYKTKMMSDVRVVNGVGEKLYFSSAASYVGPYLEDGYRQYIERLIVQEFDAIFAQTAGNLDAFRSVNKIFYQTKEDDSPVVKLDVEIEDNDYMGRAVLSLISLGIVPSHSTSDITVTCKYSLNGESRMYTFEGSLFTKTGWFVDGSTEFNERDQKRRLLLENISRHALAKYDEDLAKNK